MYVVYILECADGTLYTGITTDMERRLREHRQGIGSSYTRARGVRGVRYTEMQQSRGAALRREARIKQLTRAEKLRLIAAGVSAV